MDDDFYVLVSSNDSTSYFPANVAADFKIHLKRRMILQGHWVCALTELHCQNPVRKGIKAMCVYSNICDTSIIGDDVAPLMRRIPIQNTTNYEFKNRNYIRVALSEIGMIHIYIKTDRYKGMRIAGAVNCTLHFKWIRSM